VLGSDPVVTRLRVGQDTVVDEIEVFLTGERHRPSLDRISC
jgi:hypothetical protein